MQLDHKATKVLVTGASGSGKSTFWTRFILNWRADWKFIFDHEGEFAYRFKITPCFTAEALAGQIAGRKRGFIVFDPAKMFPGDNDAAFDFFCDWVFKMSQRLPGKKLVCVDELQMLISTGKVPRPLSTLLETGRRYGIDAAFISQQLNLIHNRIRNQLTEVVSFRQEDKTAFDMLLPKGFTVEEIKSLPDCSWISRHAKTGERVEGKLY